MHAIALRWGVEYSDTGKTVWFETPLTSVVTAPPTEATQPRPPIDGIAATRVLIASVTVDAEGTITSWGGDAERLLAWPADRVVGNSFAEITTDPDSAAIGGLAGGGGRWHGHLGILTPGGATTDVFGVHQRIGGTDTVLCLWTEPRHRWSLQPVATASPAAQSGVAGILGLADSVTARLSLDDLLEQVLRRLCTTFSGDAAYVLLTDPGGHVELRAAYGFEVDERAVVGARDTEGIAGRLGVHNLPVIVDDAARAADDPLLKAQGFRSAVAAPLVVEGRMAGSLHVAASRERAFDTDDGVRLAQVSDRVALAVESARLSEVERRRRGWLAYVAEASDLLAGTLDLDRTLSLVAQLVVPAIGEWCAVHLWEEGGSTRLAYVWHADESKADAVHAALAAMPGPERRTTDRQAPPARKQPWRPPAVESLAAYDRIVFPLVARSAVLGSLTVGRAVSTWFANDEIDVAADLARRAALAIDNARLFAERVAVVTALQRSLLPPEPPSIDGFEIGTAYLAAGGGNAVGGDFFDVFTIAADRWGFAIGDVCGKGAEAAAVTGLARHTIRLLGREGRTVAEVLDRLNRAIIEEGPRARFVTVAYAAIELAPGGARIDLCSAGHPLPMLLGLDGSVRSIGEPQSLLGVMEDPELASQRLVIARGEALVFFTDGVTERREGDRMLGENGLADILRSCAPLPASVIAARVQQAVIDYQPEQPRDDMAVVVIRVL